MSPVSRGRKPKKKSKSRKPLFPRQPEAPRPTPPASVARVASRRVPPEWFEAASMAVVEQAEVVMAAAEPRQLEQATAELLGKQLHRAVYSEHAGLWFDWWFTELTAVLADCIRDELGGGSGGWEPLWRLLHGLASVAPPELVSAVQAARRDLAAEVAAGYQAGAPDLRQPSWLPQMGRIEATGEVWEMHDAYGTRIGVVAGFCYPGGVDPSVFLFDVDACGLIDLAHAGVFDGVDEAAAAWRVLAGATAHDTRPTPVEDAERLQCLVYLDLGDASVRGNESDSVLDNWFRARRRACDIAEVLRERGMPLPEARSLYRDVVAIPAVEAFTEWYAGRHGGPPYPEATAALAYEWLEGCLPGTEHAVSPHRVRFQLSLIDDWVSDDPVTVAVKALMPEWVRWNGEQAGLPEHLVDHSVAVTAAGQGDSDCADRGSAEL